MSKTIHFIMTGGTIDKFYDPVAQGTVMRGQSSLPAYVKDFIKPDLDCSFHTVCMIDSLEMTDKIREQIMHAIIEATAERIIITHGTDTMSITAQYLKDHLPEDLDKTIVLTGALIPITEFSMSDGGFNVGFAVASVQQLSPGIYICMHGRVFEAGQVKKNTKVARFESL